MNVRIELPSEPPQPGTRQLVRLLSDESDCRLEYVSDRKQATHQIVNVAGRPFVTHLSETDQVIARELERTGVWEPAESLLLAGLVRPGTAVIDVGANVGYYSCLLARLLGRRGAVFAFEPEPENFWLLSINAAIAGSFGRGQEAPILAAPFALSDCDGKARLHVAGYNLGLHSIVDAPQESMRSVAVPSVTLDTLRFGSPSRERSIGRRVELIKSDTQGAELLLLRGGERALAEDRPILCLEYEPYLAKDRCLGVADWLESRGYAHPRLFVANEANACVTLNQLTSPLRWDDVRELTEGGKLGAYCTLLAYPS
jgi:FkbM family methyltransferase